MIQEIKKRLNIKNLVRQMGINIYRNDFIKSIYKDEKNPSLKLYPKTNSFYDFSTGKGGDVLTFYADFRNIDIKLAVKELAESEGIEQVDIYPDNAKVYENEKGRFYSFRLTTSEEEYFDERAGIMEYCENYNRQEAEQIAMRMILLDRIGIQKLIYEELENFCKGVDEQTLEYLTGHKRGLTIETIKMFRLFSIADIQKGIEFLEKNFSPDQLQISGLFNEQGKFVFYYNRLIIPYLRSGEIVYLRGRKIEDADEKFKYIGLCNYSENLSARRFFNEDVINILPDGSEMVICEGEFDAMRAVQDGLPAIGVPGVNNFPKKKLDLIKKHKIYLAFDNDLAGLKGMNEVTDIIGKPTTAIILKNHKDLTEYLNER